MRTPCNTRQAWENSKLFSEHLTESRFKYFINFLATGFLVNHLEFVSVHFLWFALQSSSHHPWHTVTNKFKQTELKIRRRRRKKSSMLFIQIFKAIKTRVQKSLYLSISFEHNFFVVSSKLSQFIFLFFKLLQFYFFLILQKMK